MMDYPDVDITIPITPPSAAHPLIRAYANIMGQAHPRGVGGVELQCAPSTGPDPTVFRQHPKYPNVQVALPSPSPPAPPHAMTGAKGGTKSLGLGRKLSRRRSPPAALAKKSMGPDPFEARPFSPLQPAFDHVELQKQSQAQQLQQPQSNEAKTVKAGTFPRSTLASAPPPPAPAATTGRTAFPTAHAAAVPMTGPHRHSSFSSIRSHKQSIKSSPSKRAEREWRAKVAAMGHLNRSPQASHARGPVPPKRSHLPALVDRRSSSPEQEQDQQLLTPTSPHPMVVVRDEGTPAKSFVSNRSFETLGHYANANIPRTPTHPQGQMPEMTLSVASPGHRQCSVPRSVVSSFYFDNRTSRVSATHPSPAKPAAMLEPEPAAPGMVQHKAGLPPFSSFQLSPASVGAPLSPVPAPVNPRASQTTPVKLSTSQGSSSSSSIPPPQTPQRAHSTVNSDHPGSGVHTPYSPTTAYILHADHVDQHLFSGNFSLDLSLSPKHQRHRHPYAGPLGGDSPPRGKMPLRPRHEVLAPQPPQVCKHHHRPPAQSHGIKAQIVGSGEQRRDRSYGGGSSTVLSRRKVDLTPGMDTGYRPPKSGLPVADLERWLASTSIAE